MQKSYENILNELRKKSFQKRIDELAEKYTDNKIIIYGAGTAFDVICENFDINKLNIIGISDIRFSDGDEYKVYKTIAPVSIPQQNPDVVLISMYDYDIAEDYFKDEIFPAYGRFKYENLIKFSFLDLLRSFFNF